MDTDTRKVSLVDMRAFNGVEYGNQTTPTLLFIPENKRNIGRCLTEIKLRSTSCNMMSKQVQYPFDWAFKISGRFLEPFSLSRAIFSRARFDHSAESGLLRIAKTNRTRESLPKEKGKTAEKFTLILSCLVLPGTGNHLTLHQYCAQRLGYEVTRCNICCVQHCS